MGIRIISSESSAIPMIGKVFTASSASVGAVPVSFMRLPEAIAARLMVDKGAARKGMLCNSKVNGASFLSLPVNDRVAGIACARATASSTVNAVIPLPCKIYLYLIIAGMAGYIIPK